MYAGSSSIFRLPKNRTFGRPCSACRSVSFFTGPMSATDQSGRVVATCAMSATSSRKSITPMYPMTLPGSSRMSSGTFVSGCDALANRLMSAPSGTKWTFGLRCLRASTRLRPVQTMTSASTQHSTSRARTLAPGCHQYGTDAKSSTQWYTESAGSTARARPGNDGWKFQ